MNDLNSTVGDVLGVGKMRTYKVDSSNIHEIGYAPSINPADKYDMYVLYRGGRLYRYEGVSRQMVTACALSASIGKYLHAKVKPNFLYEMVKQNLSILEGHFVG